jgi:hypothetical protein
MRIVRIVSLTFLACLVSITTIEADHISPELQSALGNTNQPADAVVSSSDPDFSIVLFPD